MGIGMQVAGSVAENLLQKRIRREQEEAAKATKGKSQAPDQPQPGQYGIQPSQAFADQRMGERMDYSQPEQLGGPEIYDEVSHGWDLNPLMAASLYGSGQFTKKELKKGYRKL